MADVLQLAREVKLIRSGLPIDELLKRSRLVDKLEKQFGDVKSEIKKFDRVTKDVQKTTKETTKKLNAYQKEASKLKQQVTKDAKQFAEEIKKNTKGIRDTYDKLNKPLERITKGLDKYIGAASLGFGIAGVAISFMALKSSERNQAAFDRQVDKLQSGMSKQFGILYTFKTRFDKINKEIDILKREANLVSDAVIRARNIADKAQKLANDITYEARVRIGRLNDTAAQANSNASKALAQQNTLRSQLSQAQIEVKSAAIEASKARVGVQLVDSKATTAQLQAKTAQTEATQARVGVKLVDSKATTAQANAQAAQAQAAQANAQAAQANSKAVSLQPQVTQAITTANQALAVAKGIKVTTVESTPGTGTTTANQQKMSQSEFNQYLRQNGIILRVDAAQTTAQTALEVASKAGAEPIGNKALGIGSTALSLGANNQAQLSRLDAELRQFKVNPPSLLDPRVPELQQKIREREIVDNQALQKINEIQASNALLVPAVIAGLTPAMQQIIGRSNQNLLEQLPDKTATAVQNAPCSGRGCGGRTAARVDGLADDVSALKAQIGGLPNNLGNVLNTANAGMNATQLSLLQKIDNTTTGITNKLGNLLPNGGIAGYLQRMTQWMHLDKVVNVLTLYTSVHNAYQLSSGLGQTLFSATSNVLAALGVKDMEGNPLDVGAVIGKSFDDAMKTALGVTTWEGIKTEYKKYNRIYQACSNLLFSIQSMVYNVQESINIVGGWIAQIGNGLRKDGVVSEGIWRRFNPNPDFKNPFFSAMEKLENLEEATSQIDQIASNVLSIQQTAGEISKQKDELQKAVAQVDGSRQGTIAPDATKVAEVEAATKLISKSVTIPQTAETAGV